MYKIIKYLLMSFSFLGLLIFIYPQEYAFFGIISWYFLIFLMYVRPLRDLFPKFKFLSKLVSLRKELGIISGVFAISHVVGYFILNNLTLWFVLDSIFWDLRGPMGWGTIGFIASLILLFTSNIFSMKKLGKYWKKIQRLSYLMFIFVAVHIALVKEDAMVSTSIVIIIYIIIYFLAFLKKKK